MSTHIIHSILSQKRKGHSEPSSDSSNRVSFGENKVFIIEEDTRIPLPDQTAFLENNDSDRMETYLEVSNNMRREIQRTIPILCAALDRSQPGDDAIDTFNQVLAERKLVSYAGMLLSLGTDGLPMDKNKIDVIREYCLTLVLGSTSPSTPVSAKNAKHFPSDIKILSKGIDFLKTVNKFTDLPVNPEALETFINNATTYMDLE